MDGGAAGRGGEGGRRVASGRNSTTSASMETPKAPTYPRERNLDVGIFHCHSLGGAVRHHNTLVAVTTTLNTTHTGGTRTDTRRACSTQHGARGSSDDEFLSRGLLYHPGPSHPRGRIWVQLMFMVFYQLEFSKISHIASRKYLMRREWRPESVWYSSPGMPAPRTELA